MAALKRIPHRWIDGVETKRCGHCRAWKSLPCFGANRRTWDKLNNWCRDCTNASARQRSKERPKLKATRRKPHQWIGGVEHKYCHRCKTWRALDEFHRHDGRPDGCADWCKQCKRDYDRKRYATDPITKSRRKRQSREYYQATHADQLEYHSEYRKKYAQERAAYSRQYYAEHTEEVAETVRAYRQNHPEVKEASTHRRRAQKASAEGIEYTTSDHIEGRREVWGNRCYLCGAEATTMDHVIPLARGGSHWPANLRPACVSCNSSKQDKWPYDIERHRRERGYYKQHDGGATEHLEGIP